MVIAILLLAGAWRLVREASDVLLEAAPRHIDVAEVLEELRDVGGLEDVHDLHVWTLTSGFVALSRHGVIDDPGRIRDVLDEIQERARRRGIRHVTFQLEPRPLVQIAGTPEEGKVGERFSLTSRPPFLVWRPRRPGDPLWPWPGALPRGGDRLE